MSQDVTDQSHALDGPIFSTFLKYLLPSLAGLIAMTSASLVDGIFIGNFVGVTALAAVNLIIPIMTLLFGVGLMLSIGGSVRGGKYLGTAADTQTGFIKTFLNFVGITEIEFVYAEGLAMGDGPRSDALKAAEAQLSDLAAA